MTIGTGQANTTAIVNGCPASMIAARICNDLVLNGFNDWFLPSKDELNQMYIRKSQIGGFLDAYYWSSSELNAEIVFIQSFNNGTQVNSLKYDSLPRVQAVRSF
jgi:hypothetical protein